MMILLVATLGLILAAALALWPREPSKLRDPFAPDDPTEVMATQVAGPVTLEGILAGQLLSGDISQRQYLRAIEHLAARDEERHPLIPRWDDHPGAWP